MTNTAAAQSFTADAQAIIDDIEMRLGRFNATAKLAPNAFGGFDVRAPFGGWVRVAKDDADWIIYILDANKAVHGSQRLSGCFALLDGVAAQVAVLL